jgi:hypothetical protein
MARWSAALVVVALLAACGGERLEPPPDGARPSSDTASVEAALAAHAAQIGSDPDLIADAEKGNVVGSGATIEPGYPWRYEMTVTCGIATLGEVNGIVWRTDRNDVPAAWAGHVTGDDRLEVEIVIDQATTTLGATAAGETVTYGPAPVTASPDPCAG